MGDERDYLTARDHLTGMSASTAARLIFHAELNLGGEVVPVAEAHTLDEQISRAVGNVRRLAALVEGRHPQWSSAQRLRAAVEASEMFCVAVSLSVAEIGSTPAWCRARERRDARRRRPGRSTRGPGLPPGGRQRAT